MTDTLLPINATAQERALEGASARVSDVPVPVRDLWNADACPPSVLPWLAWAYSVDVWPPGITEQQQRDTIGASVYVHRHKGTAGAVRAALASLGAGAVLTEWWQKSPAGTPYTFTLSVESSQSPITLQNLNDMLGAVDRTKNARSQLDGVSVGSVSTAPLFAAGVAMIGSTITVQFGP